MPNLTVRRIPDEIYRRLRQRAKNEGRSLNAEILAILAEEDGWIRQRLSITTAIAGLDAARHRLAKKYPHLASSADLIREDRDSR